MIETEREAERTFRYFKELRLATCEFARTIGFLVEGPVFISRVQIKNELCDTCGTMYGPRIYKQGEVVKAHHFHPPKGNIGGIFYNDLDELNLDGKSFLKPGEWVDGWMAVLEPEVDPSAVIWPGTSAEVRITQVKAFCTSCKQELKEGLVVVDEINSDFLKPLCNSEKSLLEVSRVIYEFRITEEGDVLFSQI